MSGLTRFRAAAPSPALGRRLAGLLAMVLLGAAAGVVAKWADFSSQLLGNIFSELPIWIVFGLLIARFSGSPGRAAAHAFAFFLAMIPAYYLAAEWMEGVYGMAFVYGWTVVACLSPFAAWAAWYAFGRGWLPTLLSVAVVAAAVLSDVVLLRRLNIRDLALAAVCAILVFWGKAPTQGKQRQQK